MPGLSLDWTDTSNFRQALIVALCELGCITVVRAGCIIVEFVDGRNAEFELADSRAFFYLIMISYYMMRQRHSVAAAQQKYCQTDGQTNGACGGAHQPPILNSSNSSNSSLSSCHTSSFHPPFTNSFPFYKFRDYI